MPARPGGVEEHAGRDLEALDPSQGDVLVLDVDEHVGVDGVQGSEPGRPVDGVVASAEGHEVPGGVLGPLVGPLVPAEVRAGLVRPEPAEPVVEHAVDRGGRVDPHVLGGGVEDQRAEVLDDGHRVHPLPEQVGRVQLHAEVGGARALDELADAGRVEHEVLRVELERDLDVEVCCLAVDLPPELLGDTPLVVEDVEGAGVPGVDDPVRPPATDLPCRQPRHRHDAVLAQPVGEPDAAAEVLRVRGADRRVGVQGVAVAVQPRDLHARSLEQPEEVVPRGVGGEDGVEVGDVHRGQEAARVQLDAGQPEPADHLEGLGQAAVVQDRVVDAELHRAAPACCRARLVDGCDLDGRSPACGRLRHGREDLQVVHALVEGGGARQGVGLVDPGHLLQEGAGLVDEALVLAQPDAGGVHRQPAADVGVVGAEDDPPVAPLGRRPLGEHQLELGGPLLLPRRGTPVTEDLEGQPVRVAGGDPGDLHHPHPVVERGAEAGVVVVLHRLVGVADRGPAVTGHRSERSRPLRDGGGEASAAHLADVAAEELGQVGGVAAHVGERPRTRAALVAPAHRALGVAGVVAPVPDVDVQHAAEGSGRDELAQGGDPGRAAEGEADPRDGVRAAGGGRHRPGVLQGVAERLLAQHVLAGGQQTLDHLAVQRVGHHHADHVDVRVLGHRLPGGVVPLVAEPPRRPGAELRADVGDRDVPQRRQDRLVQGGCRPVGRGVRATRHAGSDDRDADGHGQLLIKLSGCDWCH